MKLESKFSFRVWIVTILLSPFMFETGDAIINHNTFAGIIVWFMFFLGFLFSLPSLLVLYVGAGVLNYFKISDVVKKLILSFLSIAYILIAFELFMNGLSMHNRDVYLIVPYCIISVASIWICRFEHSHETIVPE